MADWPVGGLVPNVSHVIEREGPPTLRTRFEDGSESRREKHQNNPLLWRQRFRATTAEAKTVFDFVATKRLLTSFTALTYDPEAVNPDTEEASVVFHEYPSSVEIFSGLFEIDVILRKIF